MGNPESISAAPPTTVPKIGVKWLPAAIILNNPIFGNYVAASRRIEKDELVLAEIPFISGASGTASPCKPLWDQVESNDALPICLSCGKHAQATAVCSKCHWPVCNKTCEDDPSHSEAECSILAKNGVLPTKLTLSHYNSLIVLRTFLLCAKNPAIWEIVRDLETHHEHRRHSPVDRRELDFITEFIREKCKLTEYEPKAIDQVMGCLTVNAYWAYPDTGRYMSLIFDKASLFSHDCDPNTRRKIVEKEVILDGVKRKVMVLEVHATRVIELHEPISISYIPRSHDSNSVAERQRYLKAYFYFTCKCKRCIRELENLTDNENVPVENQI